MTENKAIHHATRKAADMSLARREISRESHAAIMEGWISLDAARELGRDRGLDTAQASGGQRTATRTQGRATGERSEDGPPKPQRICICGCGKVVRGKKSRFRPGHDARLHSELKRNLEKDPLLRNERFSDEQRAYAVERGLIAE